MCLKDKQTTPWPSWAGSACERASEPADQGAEQGRLMAYLGKSSRYVSYDSRWATGQALSLFPPVRRSSSHTATGAAGYIREWSQC